MTVYVQDPDFTLHLGDVREVLATLEPESVDCALTSPPFYALRDYGVEGQIGLEETPDEWVAALVEVFAGVRRVLKPTGTLWIECGDSYGRGRVGRDDDCVTSQGRDAGWKTHPEIGSRERPAPAGVKDKDLLGQPWLLAFALRADGWYLRQCIIWAKPNAMPESAKDRCTTAHSYVFLFSKQPRYYFDAEAIAEPAEWARWGNQTVPKYEGTETASGWMQPKTKAELATRYVNPGNRSNNGRYSGDEVERRGFEQRLERADGMKNARSVWTIPTEGFPEAHFATWPQALAERIIKAGCPEGGTVLDPFGGSGTTALVARRLGRRSVLVELNESYCAMAARRLSQLSLLA